MDSRESIDERALIRRVVDEGDQAAFAHIVQRYQTPIRSYLGTLMRNWEEARDLSQETFVKAFQHLEQYRGDGQFSSWLFRIANNLAISAIRKEKRRNTVPLPESGNVVDGKRTPEQAAIHAQHRAILRSAVQSLPPKYRVPIVLRDIEGLSYEEISRIMKRPLGTVKSRVNRGRFQLSQHVKAYFNGDLS